ncbi:hypothetical protein AA313_de0207633 [Arthrobotrys entomopaga]|nr:hypothetical protein AA313_de0207633 [Arthrobotrys entomopaga]
MAIFAYSPTDELAQLFKRQSSSCVKCPDTPPSCKTHVCEAGLTCVLGVQTCNACAEVTCQQLIPKSQTTAAANSSGGSSAPVGAIVGGIFGFLVVLVVAVFFLIRRNKKKQKEAYEASVAAWAVEKDGSSYRDARASTHSVGSIASTVLTRASNVIQIAYIPGVTNRSNPNSPGLLGVPPVPSIPGQHLSEISGDHFFSANDIARQSVWSTNSGYTVDPRASVATTIYRSNAVVSPLAATAQVVRAKVAVVNVKSSPAVSGASTPHLTPENTPPVPSIDLSKFPAPKANDGHLSPGDPDKGPNSPAFSVGSTFLNKMSMSTVPEEEAQSTASSPKTPNDDPSPFSDRQSILIEQVAVAPLSIKHQGKASPARHMSGDIRMSFRPISEIDQQDESSRGKSPFGDENRVGGKS